MKFLDTSGRLHHVLCALVLFVHHGLRDFLITGIPSLSSSVSEDNSDPNVTTPHPPVQNIALYIQIQLTKYENIQQQGWTDGATGGVLSSVHWGILIPLVLSPIIIPRISRKYLLAASLLASGIVSLFSELASQNGYTGLLILRLIQGVLQGWCYPLVFYMLEDSQSLSFVFPYFFIFFAPWLGSAFGVVLGWVENPFVGSYVMGSMSIILGGIFLISSNKTKPLEKPERTWRECLSSPALWSCVLLCMASTWALHSILVGLSFTLYFKFNKNNLMWMVVVVIFVGGLITRIIAMVAMRLLRNNFLSPRNRRRIIIIAGTLIVIACLVLNATYGLNSEYALFGVSIIGVGLGVGLLLVGIRLNLHDLGPLFPTPFLLLGSIGGTVGAALASLLFPILAQKDSIDPEVDDNDGPLKKAWMVPIGPVAVACCLHIFLVSVRPLAHQTLLKRSTAPVLKLNGAFDASEEMDAKSFKSLKSALSFKTAVSKQRSRTVSFQTIADNVEFDLHSLQDSKSDDCVSIGQLEDGDDNAEMKSIKSGITSFKSATNSRSNSVDANQHGIALNVKDLDRTSVWLSTHHDKNYKFETQNSVEKNTVERNILLALQW